VIAAVVVIAIVKAPALFVGGSITGAALKVGKMILKRTAG
jgi:hypothetical protein